MEMLILFIPLIAMVFFMQRSQKKQQKQRQDLLASMTTGSQVVTIGGLHGVIAETNESKGTVTLDCEGIFLEFDRASIRTVKPGVVSEVEATDEVEAIDTEENSDNENE